MGKRGALVADTDKKTNGENWRPLKIPDLNALPELARSGAAFLLMALGIVTLSCVVALFANLVVAIFFERNFEDARNIALILAALVGAPFVMWRVLPLMGAV